MKLFKNIKIFSLFTIINKELFFLKKFMVEVNLKRYIIETNLKKIQITYKKYIIKMLFLIKQNQVNYYQKFKHIIAFLNFKKLFVQKLKGNKIFQKIIFKKIIKNRI